MVRGTEITSYNIPGYPQHGWPSVEVSPSPQLEVDARPLSGTTLREWRHCARRRGRRKKWQKQDHFSQHEFAKYLNINPRHYRALESTNEITTGWAPLLRLVVDEKRQVPDETANAPAIKALGRAVGGYPTIAEELGVAHSTVLDWGVYGAPRRYGYGLLLQAVVEDIL